MGSKRQSPRFFRSKGAAIACFAACFALLAVIVYVGVGMLARYDYDAVLPEDAELRATFAENGYIPVTLPPTPVPEPTVAALPTPMPTPASTPIPIDLYSLQDTRMVMPESADLPGEAQLTCMRVSDAPEDANKVILVTGWAFLDGYDAEQSRIYLVVSGKNAAVHRFYEATKLPGSTGIEHDGNRGQNLERADFRAVFTVRSYEEGPYRLGVLVQHKMPRSEVVQGYFPFDGQYNFFVKKNAVFSVG